eukprot:TRINITY_DN2612_c0_g1_i2.p1 TRINITY_DN2612_c0_g1~~TRINITY_DN2612_c0_g1_i2.p1  ORF type:complete len:307 (-),score=108.59 TRINITY_DN2612_c0_g1_i2:108-992(-)
MNDKNEEKDYGPSSVPKYMQVPLESLDDSIKKNKFKNNKKLPNKKGNQSYNNKNKKDDLSIVITVDKNQNTKIFKGNNTNKRKNEGSNNNLSKQPKKDGENEDNGENKKTFVVKKTIENEKELTETSKEVRCTRFPKCPFAASCHYYHPTKRCTYWPNCAFADEQCKSIHPQMIPCKFKESCTRPDCAYIHPDQQMALMRFNNSGYNKGGTYYSTNKKFVNPNQPIVEKTPSNNAGGDIDSESKNSSDKLEISNMNDSTNKIDVNNLDNDQDEDNIDDIDIDQEIDKIIGDDDI